MANPTFKFEVDLFETIHLLALYDEFKVLEEEIELYEKQGFHVSKFSGHVQTFDKCQCKCCQFVRFEKADFLLEDFKHYQNSKNRDFSEKYAHIIAQKNVPV